MTLVVGSFDPVVRPGLSHALRSDPRFAVLVEDLDGSDLEGVVRSQRPSVVLVANIVGCLALEGLRGSWPSAAVVVFVAAPASSYGWLLLALGASCVAQGTSVDALLDAIHFAGCGGRVFVAEDGERVEREPADVTSLLTARELVILEHLNDGDSYASIALALGIAIETVRKHAASIRRKLNISRRVELVGLLDSLLRV
ncbi:MAG: response regulator transcription factor [Solirubrobacteraceae bacterium]